MSESSPIEGYRVVAVRPGGISDSLTISGLVNGRTYYFRAGLMDEHRPPVAASEPIAAMPHATPLPLLTIDLGRSGWGGYGAAWSPDGSRIAFVRADLGHARLCVVELGSGAEQILLDDPGIEHLAGPAWSPDGRLLAYRATPSLTNYLLDYRIWLIEPDGGSRRSVTPGRIDSSPAWASDSLLVFSRGSVEPPNIHELYRVDPGDTNSMVAITGDQSLSKGHPSVRRSDGLIAFHGTPRSTDHSQVYTVPIMGGPNRPLITSRWWDSFMPTWSPDGQRIAYMSDRSGHPDVWLFDMNSRVSRQFTTGRRGRVMTCWLLWSPDGSRVGVLEQGADGHWRLLVHPTPIPDA